ncbi:MAG: substrate-binding protein [Azospirillaceae bacterium]
MARITRRSAVAGLAGTAAALPLIGPAASGFAPAIAQGAPVRLGAVLPFSGGLELFGNQARLGIDLAVAELNDAGGILDRPVEVIYADNQTDPATSVERANSLIRGDEVTALTGPITSNARDAMAATVERFETPLLYATNYEGGACGDYMFSFNTVPNQELARLLPAMNERFGSSFYLFGADYVWPQKMFETAEGIIGGFGGTVAGTEFTPWGVKDFTPVIRRIEESGADVLVFALPGADGITFIKQADSFGLLDKVKVAFLGFAETYLGAFGEGRGDDMWVTVPFASSLDTPEAQDFVARIRAQAGEDVPISHYVMTHYTAIKALAAATTAADSLDRPAIARAMAGLTVEAPTGAVTVGTDHHVTLTMYLARSAGGALEVVEPLGRLAPESGCATS